MIRDLLRRAAIIAKATEIADEIMRRYPLELDEIKPSESKAEIKKKKARLGKALNYGRSEIRKTTREMKLGIYGRARLCKSVQENLLQKEYSPDAVKMFIEQLAVSI